jgi:RNA polymerase sigma-70 factor (ECF subfamily)
MLDGDMPAAEKLIKKYKKELLGFCYTRLLSPQLAEDCYQETWEKAFRKLNTFDQSLSFRAWIFTICRNTICDEIRKSRAASRGGSEKYSLDVEYYETLLSARQTTEQLAINKGQRTELLEAVYSLPDKQKEIVILRYFHSKTFSEISVLLKVPESTIKYRLEKALKLMKKRLGDDWYV